MQRFVLSVFLLISMVLAGCSEQGFRAVDKTVVAPKPAIEVSPTLLDFGAVASGEEVLRSFTVTNIGETALHVTNIELDTTSPFAILSADADFEYLLDPSEEVVLEVVYEPSAAAEASGEITVFSDDWDEPQIVVELIALAAVPELVISPDSYDFGDSPIPCDEQVELTLTNIGGEALIIDSLEYTASTGEMLLHDANQWPMTLHTNDSTTVTVEFVPTMTGPATGILDVVSNDPRGVVSADQIGEGIWETLVEDQFTVPDAVVDVYQAPTVSAEDFTAPDYRTDTFSAPASQTDTFTAPEYETDTFMTPPLLTDSFVAPSQVTDNYTVVGEPPVDILFAVDQSGSMDLVNTALGDAFQDFIDEIQAVTTGWHIGVVTEDDGCFTNGVLDENTANVDVDFMDAVTTGGCAGGWPSCLTESLLELTSVALSETGPGGCNDGFLRPGALLHVIVVSDELEQSGWVVTAQQGQTIFYQPNDSDWQGWGADFASYLTSASLLKVSGIVDHTQSCGDLSGADGYEQLINYTGGELLDVCTSDWTIPSAQAELQGLASSSLSAILDYTLSQPADETTVQVFVDGVEWTSDWTYDATTNSVTLDVAVTDGTDIEITYVPVGGVGSFTLSDTPDETTIVVYVDGVETSTGWSYDASTNTIVFSPALVDGEVIDVEYATVSSAVDYTLSGTPDQSTITVQVGGSTVSNWTYNASSNSIVFTGSVATSASVTVSYLPDSASMSYALSATPDETTIVVTVDGTVWTTDWHYDSTTNSIVFDVEVADGQTIEVTYSVAGTGGSYSLAKTPVESTITVTVDGVQWNTGWTYNSATNSVQFSNPLTPGAVVEVTYLRSAANSSYTLARIPVVNTVVVYVDGVQWTTDWYFDSSTNSVVFDVPLDPSAVVEVEYIAANDWVDYLLSGTAQASTIVVTVDGQVWTTGWTYDAASDSVIFDVDPPEGATIEITYVDPSLFGPMVLSETPVESTIEVYLDGTLVSNGWTYDSSTDAIEFSADLPPGTVVDVSYHVPSVCP
jgi:hypothetical protein